MSPGPQVLCAQRQLRRCPSRVCAYRRRKRRILDEVAHLDFIGRARPSAPRTAEAALVVVDLSVRDERDLVRRQPADVAADAVHVQAVAQGHHAAGGHVAVAEVGRAGHASDYQVRRILGNDCEAMLCVHFALLDLAAKNKSTIRMTPIIGP